MRIEPMVVREPEGEWRVVPFSDEAALKQAVEQVTANALVKRVRFDEVRIELQVSGEVQPEPGQKTKAKKSKRR